MLTHSFIVEKIIHQLKILQIGIVCWGVVLNLMIFLPQ